MKIDDYRALIHEDISIACDINSSSEAEEFLSYTIGLLINGEEFDEIGRAHV